MTYFIDLRAQKSGGDPVSSVDDVFVRTDEQLTPSSPAALAPDLIAAIQGKDVLLGTHGFNVDRSGGMTNLSHWADWLQLGANGIFVAVLWPGDSSGIHGVDYPVEGNEAIKSGQLLAGYLKKNFTGANSLSFASHSLGARVVLQTIQDLSHSLTLKTVTLMAGAIDDTCLSGEYKDAATQMCRISVLASHKDAVLKWAFPAGNFFAGIVSRGDPYWHGALGREGPNPPNQPSNICQTPILPDSWNFGHHSYINYQTPEAGQELAKPVALPVVVPGAEADPIPTDADSQQALAAGFVSTRFPCAP